MRIVAGGIPLGEDFYSGRNLCIENLKDMLQDRDVLIVGPRRTGKTSVIKNYIAREEKNSSDFKAVFIDLESTENLYEFYLRIIRVILNASSKWKLFAHIGADYGIKLVNKLHEMFEGQIPVGEFMGLPEGEVLKLKIPHIDAKKLEALREELKDVLTKISEPITIVLDEFPELIWKLGKNDITATEEEQELIRKQQASFLLSGLRTIRQENDGEKKVHKVILAGSVNLDNTLEELGLAAQLNDISRLHIPYLSPSQVVDMLQKLSNSNKLLYWSDDEFANFIKSQFGKCTPFYVQVFAELLLQHKLNNPETERFVLADIKRAYKSLLLNKRGPNYLFDRINKYYEHFEEEFVKEVIKIIAINRFTKKESTPEKVCLEYALKAIKLDFSRERQVGLLGKLRSDDLIQVSEDGEGYDLESQVLCNFWHYKLVGDNFLI